VPTSTGTAMREEGGESAEAVGFVECGGVLEEEEEREVGEGATK